ncbi:MAG: PAS domain S-box protein [Proteobacteria bacterium]|nr:PAS domain S-box protein [Pseudomonadota bacterium]
MRICVVDDNILIGDALSLVLRDHGHEAAFAADAATGLKCFEQGGFDAVVVDCALPDALGERIATTIRAQWPATVVILVSGRALPSNIDLSSPCAPDAFLQKPRSRAAKGGRVTTETPLVSSSTKEDSRLRALVDTAVDGVILIDARGSILMFNPACERLFGYEADEVLGRNVKALMPPSFHDEHDGYLHNFRTSGVRKIIGIGREVVGQRKDGTTFPMDLSVGESKEGDEVFFVGIIHDLTLRKRTEEQLAQAQKMETVGQLSGGIAHDFNNLLTVILGNAEALSERLRARPDLQVLCDGILAAGQRGAELTKHLLAFGRRQVLQPVPIDCNELLGDLQRLLQRTLREDIEISLQLKPTLVLALADPTQLESAVINLALNAQDAMPTGGRLTFSTALAPLDERYRDLNPEVQPGDYVLICVTDEGIGMTPEVRERAFEPFFTTKEVGKGSGLGLSMVYGFIKQSGGHVAIYSEPSLGTSVRLYLPCAGSNHVEAGATLELAERDAPRGGESILVVEDDPFVRGYAVAALEGLGYNVRVAANGPEALLRLNGHDHIDLLFTDVVMPGGMSGWDLARKANELCPGIKVLLTSGYALDTLIATGRALQGGEMILMKPYRKADLAWRVRQTLTSDAKSEDEQAVADS